MYLPSRWRGRAMLIACLSTVSACVAPPDEGADTLVLSQLEQGATVGLSISAPSTIDGGQDLIYTINLGVSDEPITDAVLTFSMDDINGLNTPLVDDGLASDAEATYGVTVRQMRPVTYVTAFAAGPFDTSPTTPSLGQTSGTVRWEMGDINDGFVDTATVVVRAPYNTVYGATIAAKVKLTYKVGGVPFTQEADTAAAPAAYAAMTTHPYDGTQNGGATYQDQANSLYVYNAYVAQNRDTENVRFRITSTGTCTPRYDGVQFNTSNSGETPTVVSAPTVGQPWSGTLEFTFPRGTRHPYVYVLFTAPASCAIGTTVQFRNQGTIYEGGVLQRSNDWSQYKTVSTPPVVTDVVCPSSSGTTHWQKSYRGLLLQNPSNYYGDWVQDYYTALRAGEASLWTHYYSNGAPNVSLANRYQITTVPNGLAFGGYPQGVVGNVFKDCSGTALVPNDPAFNASNPTFSGWYDVAETWTGIPFTKDAPITDPRAEAGPGCRILVQAGATSAGHNFQNYPLMRACEVGESCYVADSDAQILFPYSEYSTRDDGNPATFDTVACYTQNHVVRRKTEAMGNMGWGYLDESTNATTKAILAGDSLEFSFMTYNYVGASQHIKAVWAVDLSSVKNLLDLDNVFGSVANSSLPANGQNVVGERCKVSDILFVPPDTAACRATGGTACLARWHFPEACQPANGQYTPRMKLIAPILRTAPSNTQFNLQATARNTNNLAVIGFDNPSPVYNNPSSNVVTVTVLAAPSLAVTQSSPILWPADSTFLSTQVVSNTGNAPLTGIYTVAQLPQAGVSGSTVTPGVGRMFVNLPAAAGTAVLEASSTPTCFSAPTGGVWTSLGGLQASARPGFAYQSVNVVPPGSLCVRTRLTPNGLGQIGLAVTERIETAVELDTALLGDGDFMVERAKAGVSSALHGSLNLPPVSAQDEATTISSELAVVVSKTAVADPSVAGRTRWIIHYVNRSGMPGAAIEITDTLPDDSTFAGLATPLDPGETCTTGGAGCGAIVVGADHVVRFEVAALQPFDGAPDTGLDEGTIELFTDSAPGDTDITNCAIVTASDPANDYTIPGCASTQESAIVLTKQIVGGMTEVAEGAPIPYLIVAQNTGTQASSVTVVDQLPLGTALVPGTIQINGATASDNLVSGGQFTYTHNRLVQPGQTLQIRLALAADASQIGGTVINTATGQGCVNPLYPASCAVAVASAGISVAVYADADGDGVGNDDDSHPDDPYRCADADADTCDDCAISGPDGSGGDPSDDGTDADFDGFCDAYENDLDNDGVCDLPLGLPGCQGGPDTLPGNGNVCRDLDGDSCDDCTNTGADRSGGDVANDGPDNDGDGICNAGDIDSDNDGVCDTAGSGAGCVAGPDTAPYDPAQCRDADRDGCDDCSTGAFGGDPASDGPDPDGDGVCNTGDPADHDPAVCGDGDHDTCDDCAIVGHQAWANDGLDTDADIICNPGEVLVGLDANDADSDDDGVRDGYEPAWWQDSDQDGLINASDSDSDDDGLFDGTELGVSVAGPGTDENAPSFVPDADAGATTTDPLTRDTDNDGIPDGAEDANHDGQLGFGETNPLVPTSYAALVDSDGDFLSDDEEGFLGTDPGNPDTDGDGVWDGYEPNFADDTDGDGDINALDTDSDADGILDGVELLMAGGCAWTSAVNPDTDGGGLPDGVEDADHDGCVSGAELNPNVRFDDRASDSDGDGIADVDEGFGDDDNDGTPNYLDDDVDGDGILDADEAGDADPQTPPADTDGDGTPDFRDDDGDGDGILDLDEAGDVDPLTPPADTDGDDVPDFRDDDVDGDGILDVHEAGDADPLTPPADTDGDDVPDFRDDDVDGDGLLDVLEAGDADPLTPPIDTDGDGLADFRDPDADDDLVADAQDNCPLVSNANQLNTDGANDGGDACDGDDDNDTVADGSDNCPINANQNQLNTDGDAQGDACDSDDDGDGVADAADNCPLISNANQTNTDGANDGGDACDADDDGDGGPTPRTTAPW
jgi:uncharacterized repeat protein (TIGR01451 family)